MFMDDSTFIKQRPPYMGCIDVTDFADVADAPSCDGDDEVSWLSGKCHSMDDIYKMARQIPDDLINKLRLGISIRK